MFQYCFKLIWGRDFEKDHHFSKFYCFYSFLHSSTPSITLQIYFLQPLQKTKFKVLMQNYFLANFRLHHFKSVGYRKLAKLCKQIAKKKFLNNFLSWNDLTTTCIFSISNYWYKLTQPNVQYWYSTHMFTEEVYCSFNIRDYWRQRSLINTAGRLYNTAKIP